MSAPLEVDSNGTCASCRVPQRFITITLLLWRQAALAQNGFAGMDYEDMSNLENVRVAADPAVVASLPVSEFKPRHRTRDGQSGSSSATDAVGGRCGGGGGGGGEGDRGAERPEARRAGDGQGSAQGDPESEEGGSDLQCCICMCEYESGDQVGRLACARASQRGWAGGGMTTANGSGALCSYTHCYFVSWLSQLSEWRRLCLVCRWYGCPASTPFIRSVWLSGSRLRDNARSASQM